MTAPTLPDDPLFIERVPGVGLINIFEDMLLKYDITPAFAHKVVAKEKHGGAYFLNGYFAFEHRQKIDVDYIFYQILSIIEEFSTQTESGEKTLFDLARAYYYLQSRRLEPLLLSATHRPSSKNPKKPGIFSPSMVPTSSRRTLWRDRVSGVRITAGLEEAE